MESNALQALEEKIVNLVSKLAKVKEENTRLKERILVLEKELKEKDNEIRALTAQRDAVQIKIDRLIRRIEEYQEVLSQEEENGQG